MDDLRVPHLWNFMETLIWRFSTQNPRNRPHQTHSRRPPPDPPDAEMHVLLAHVQIPDLVEVFELKLFLNFPGSKIFKRCSRTLLEHCCMLHDAQIMYLKLIEIVGMSVNQRKTNPNISHVGASRSVCTKSPRSMTESCCKDVWVRVQFQKILGRTPFSWLISDTLHLFLADDSIHSDQNQKRIEKNCDTAYRQLL